jgi:TRAP-type C4-dicarboxylate transport system permease large subunit
MGVAHDRWGHQDARALPHRFGLCYYAACIIGRVPSEADMKRIWLYLGALSIGLIAIAFIPWISIGFL